MIARRQLTHAIGLIIVSLLLSPGVSSAGENDDNDCDTMTDEEICDSVPSEGHGGGWACCDDRRVTCVWEENLPPDKRTDERECMDQIVDCIHEHEQSHIDMPYGVCNDSGRGGTGYPVSGDETSRNCARRERECAAHAAQMECISEIVLGGSSECAQMVSDWLDWIASELVRYKCEDEVWENGCCNNYDIGCDKE